MNIRKGVSIALLAAMTIFAPQQAALADDAALQDDNGGYVETPDGTVRTFEVVDSYSGNSLMFDLMPGDAIEVSPDGQYAAWLSADGSEILTFDSPVLQADDGPGTLPGEFLVIDNTLQIVPENSGDVSLNEHKTCFESWLASFVVGTSGSLLVCLPLGIANPIAGVACTVAMGATTAALDYSKSCG